MKNDQTLLLEMPEGGGAAKGRAHWEWRENRISSYMIRIFKEDGEEMTWLSEMSKRVKCVCHCTEGREKVKWGRTKELTKN